MCRSTRRYPAARVEFMLDDAAPIAAITTAELAGRLDGRDLLVVDVDDPAVDSPTEHAHCRRRIPTTSRTSSTPRALPVSPKGVAITAPQRDPAAGRLWTPGWGCRRARCGRSAIRWRSTSRCGRSSVRCCMAGGWWWCPTSVVRSPEDLHALLVAEQVSVSEPDPVGVLCAANRRCAVARAGTSTQARGGGVRR